MTGNWKKYLAVAFVGAALGFALGAVGSHFENYYILNGPSFPELSWGWLRFFGNPGYLLAGRTGPHGFIDFNRSYEILVVAAWDSLVWAVVLPLAVLGTRRLLELLAAKKEA